VTRLIAVLMFLLCSMTNPAHALIEGSDWLRVKFQDAQTSPTATYSPALTQRVEGLFFTPQSGHLWVQTNTYSVGKSNRPPREAVITAQVHVDGLQSHELSVFVRYSADGKRWSNWSNMPASGGRSGNWEYQDTVLIPRVARHEFDEKMEEWARGGGDVREEQHLFLRWADRRGIDLFKNEIPFVKFVEVRIEIDSPKRLGVIREIAVETHWTARLDD
jgi:hypothetical protein